MFFSLKITYLYSNMNSLVHIKVFNNLLNDFLNFLEETFPIISSDIILTRSIINVLGSNNPRIIVEQFMSSVSMYKKQIFDCDEKFFLNFEENGIKVNSQNLMHGLKIKQLWLDSKTTNEQKAYIWLYFQKLLRTGEKVLL
jgi:hypothetical protein